MKKFGCIVFFTCLLLGFSALANVSETPEEKPAYCPAEIKCTGTTLSSCTYPTDHPEYFTGLNLWNVGYPTPATYPYVATLSSFHSNLAINTCQYMLGKAVFLLQIKPPLNLEASFKEGNNWIISADGTATCGSPVATCPLKEKSGFVIHNSNVSGGVFASISDIQISKLIPVSTYTSVIYDDALVGCSSEKQCTIDLVSPKGAKYGSVIVDMDNKLKVLQVVQQHPSEVQLHQIDSFNAVEISYPSLK